MCRLSLRNNSLTALALLLFSSTVYSQSTTFTFQGRLQNGGVPANGTYDLQFKLFETPTVGTGAQQGPTVTIPNVQVTSGVFGVKIDFGMCATCFDGSVRFLEIAAKPTSSADFTIIGRQEITSAPYSIKSKDAAVADNLSGACVNCVTSSQIQTVEGNKVTGNISGSQINGVIPVASVPGNSGNYIQNTTSQQPNASFNIDGDGTVAGTLSGTAVSATTQYILGGNRILSIPGFRNLFVGVGAGQANASGQQNTFLGFNAGASNIDGGSNTFVGSNTGGSNLSSGGNSFFGYGAGFSNTGNANSYFGLQAGGGFFSGAGSSNSYFGYLAGQLAANGNQNSFFGANATGSDALSNASAIGANAQVTQSDSLILGSIAGVNGATTDTHVGIGTTAPNAFNKLEVAGAANRNGVFASGSGIFGTAIKGSNNDGTAVGGVTSNGIAVSGTANGDGTGVGGSSFGNGIGVLGTSNDGIAIKGVGTSWFAGDTTLLPCSATGSGAGVAVGSFDYGYLFAYDYCANSAKTLALNHPGGFVGIGTNAPVRTLTVNGRARIASIPLEASTATVCFNSAGDLLQCGASSLRWKTNVQPFLPGLDVVSRLRPISFNWKEGGATDIGLGAEDVAKIAPSLTFVNSKGEAEGVKYERLSMVLINAVKEQQKQIDLERREIAQLKHEVERLQAARRRLRGHRLETAPSRAH